MNEKMRKNKNTLINEWKKARDNFMMYSLKASYGNICDRYYNTEQANIWDRIISDLRIKIIH